MTTSEQARGWPKDIDEPNQMMDTIMPSVNATRSSLKIRHAANLGLLSYAGTRTAATRRFPFRPLLVPAIPPTRAFGSLRRRLWCYRGATDVWERENAWPEKCCGFAGSYSLEKILPSAACNRSKWRPISSRLSTVGGMQVVSPRGASCVSN